MTLVITAFFVKNKVNYFKGQNYSYPIFILIIFNEYK
jgi:hypothetical protein